MHSFFAKWIRPGIFILFCAGLIGCAVDTGPASRPPSLEEAVQTVLAKQGYNQGPIDGTLGPATSRAIRNYQRDHHLTPTGTINPALAASMGLIGQQSVNVSSSPYYAGYPYYPWYAAPAFFAPPAVIGLGWGGWSAGSWNRGWGGWGWRGYGGNYGWRGYGGNYGRGYGGYGWRGNGGNYGRGWCR